MKKIFLATFAMLTLVLASCTNDDINISTTPKIRTLTYVVNTQSIYDELGLTSEVVSNYLGKNYSVGVYTFIYDAEQNLVTTKSSKESSFGTSTESFQLEEGTYTVITYEALVGNGYTPSWRGEDKMTTLTFNDNSSVDYHYILGSVETKVSLVGGDKTETASPAATRHLLTLNIGTQSMYDTFGRNEYENVYLSNNNYYVGVTSLIYDNSGQFVDSVCTYIKTFQSIQQKFSLREGSYTIVTVETLVNGDSNYTSDSWKIDNIQNLSSVVLLNSTNDSAIYWGGVVGTSNCTVSMANSNHSQNVVPSAIGSLVNVTAVNFDKSDYSIVLFETKNSPDGIMLSPNVTEKYFYSKYEEQNWWKYRGYKGNLSSYEFPESVNITLYVIESGLINWCLGCANESYVSDDGESFNFDSYPDKNSFYTFQDGQTYYAYIRYRGDEKGCDANIGTYDEVSKWVNSLEPVGVLFVEPYTTWGGTVSAVKSYMSGYRAGNNGNLVESNGNYVLWYYGKNKESEIQYYFTSSTGGLTNAVLFFDADKVGEDDLSKAFTEMGYEFVLSGDGYSAYSTKDSKSFVMVRLNSENYWVLNYFSASSSSAPRRTVNKNFSTFAPRQNRAFRAKNFDKVDIVNQLRRCENTMKLYFK